MIVGRRSWVCHGFFRCEFLVVVDCCGGCGFQCNGGFAKGFGTGLFWVVVVVVANPRLERMG